MVWDNGMTTHDVQHWFTRCGKHVQEWLLTHPDGALTASSLDAVISAGGVPVRRGSDDDHS